ncbi:MAG TPA: SMP-30/gluconolactonase/LRE family protein [Pseudonocardia sp.]|jgi:sugar lactone lactonase YvrE
MLAAMASVRSVADGFSFLECPRWHEGQLWVSDFYTARVLAVDDPGAAGSPASVRTVVDFPGQPSGLGWLPDGRLLMVSMRDRRVLRRESDGSLAEHADLSGVAPEHLNDMLVDGAGRAYVGNFGFDLMSGADVCGTTLARVDPDGRVSVVADGLVFPNGMALLDGGRTLVVAESFGNRLSGFTVGPDGELTDRRDWARFGDPPAGGDPGEALAAVVVAPDGICAAPDGTVWVADAFNKRAVRVAEGGEIVQEVSSGDLNVYACALGGADGRTLYLCAAPSFAEHERRDTREGVLLAATV